MTVALSPAQDLAPGFPGVGRLIAIRPPSSAPQGAAAIWSHHLARLGPLPPHVATRLAEMASSAGLLGRGGAGFPTGTKIAAVAANASRAHPAVVVANCCDGDPTSSKDGVLLAHSPHLVIDGALLAAAATGARKVVLAVHQGARTVDDLRIALAVRERLPITVEIVGIPPRFVASEATALVRYLNTGDARPAGRMSKVWESGVGGRPTLVDNAETLAQLALIARFGPDWFRQLGTEAEPGTVLVTVGGSIGHPGVVEAAGGTPIRTILQAAGWRPGQDRTPVWVLVGGLAGRWIDIGHLAGIGFSAAELTAVGGTKGVSSMVVLPVGGCVLMETARILQYLADSGARQCGPCMFGLPAVALDMSALARGDRDALSRLHRRLPVIDKRGGCGHPDGAVALATSALRAMTGPESRHLEAHLRQGGCAAPSAVVPLDGHGTADRAAGR